MERSDTRSEYEFVRTETPRVELRVLKGQGRTIPEEVLSSFLEVAKEYAEMKWKLDELTVAQKKRREKLLQFVSAIPGLRGVHSLRDGFSLLAVEREKKVIWDRSLLKTSLGEAYPILVSEELVATISVPEQLTTEEKLRAGVAKLLAELGVPEADIPKLLKTELSLLIDTQKLESLLAEGRMELLPGTRETKVDWAIEVDLVLVPQETKKEPRRGAKL